MVIQGVDEVILTSGSIARANVSFNISLGAGIQKGREVVAFNGFLVFLGIILHVVIRSLEVLFLDDFLAFLGGFKG